MPSLALYHGKHMVYQTDGPWLYPLLELEQWLTANSVDTADLLIYDKIVGRAGALLISRLGFRSVRTDLISKLAIEIFDLNRITWVAADTTDRILCATESLLEGTTDGDVAHRLITERARAARARETDQSVLTVENLNVVRDGRHILSAVDFRIEGGDRILIRGENGAGKTTLLRAVLGLIPLSAGRVIFNGEEVGTPRWRRVRKKMAYVRQRERNTTLPISAGEVAGIGSPALTHRLRHAARNAAVQALSLMGVDHLAHRPFAELSGGEQRRVSIARAFAQNPTLLVLDEPTAGLDQSSRSTLLQLIDSAASEQRIAILMVTHDPFDRSLDGWGTYTLENGRLASAAPKQPIAATASGKSGA